MSVPTGVVTPPVVTAVTRGPSNFGPMMGPVLPVDVDYRDYDYRDRDYRDYEPIGARIPIGSGERRPWDPARDGPYPFPSDYANSDNVVDNVVPLDAEYDPYWWS